MFDCLSGVQPGELWFRDDVSVRLVILRSTIGLTTRTRSNYWPPRVPHDLLHYPKLCLSKDVSLIIVPYFRWPRLQLCLISSFPRLSPSNPHHHFDHASFSVGPPGRVAVIACCDRVFPHPHPSFSHFFTFLILFAVPTPWRTKTFAPFPASLHVVFFDFDYDDFPQVILSAPEPCHERVPLLGLFCSGGYFSILRQQCALVFDLYIDCAFIPVHVSSPPCDDSTESASMAPP